MFWKFLENNILLSMPSNLNTQTIGIFLDNPRKITKKRNRRVIIRKEKVRKLILKQWVKFEYLRLKKRRITD